MHNCACPRGRMGRSNTRRTPLLGLRGIPCLGCSKVAERRYCVARTRERGSHRRSCDASRGDGTARKRASLCLTAIEESPGAPHPRISVIAPTDVRRRRLRAVLACLMIGMGILHVAVPGPFVRIMPAALPVPLMLVLVSGFFEVLGGIGLLVRHLAFQAGRSGQGCRCKVCSSPGLCGWGPMGRGRRRVPEPRLELVGRARTLQGVGGHGDWPQWSWTLVDSAPGPGGHRAACFRASVQPNQIPSICT
jgi:hypothetical protein